MSIPFTPRLTVGFPHWNDFKGLWFTVQALAAANLDMLPYCDLLIVNDSPGSDDAKRIDSHLEWWRAQGWHSVRVLHQPSPMGPAQAKNRVFEESQTEWTLCGDCHILFTEQPILSRTIEFCEYLNEVTKSDEPADHSVPWPSDLFSGPIVYDNLHDVDTELAPVWRGDAWGTWTSNPAGRDPLADPYEIWDQGKGLILARSEDWLGFHPLCRGFGGEEGCLAERYRKHGRKVWCVPFLRWNHFFSDGNVKYPLQRYSKVRNFVLEFLDLQGRLVPNSAVFNPFPKPKHIIDTDPRVELPTSGYVLLDPSLAVPSPENYSPPSLDSIHRHMVSLEYPGDNIANHLVIEHSVGPEHIEGKSTEDLEKIHKEFKITQGEWDHLLADPINNLTSPLARQMDDVEFTRLLATAIQTEKDMNKHLPILRKLATGTARVVDVTRRIESTIALISARPKYLHTIVYGPESADPMYGTLLQMATAANQPFRVDAMAGWRFPEISDCELMFFKCEHNYHNMAQDLSRWYWQLKGRLIIHDTTTHAENWADGDGGEGLASGIKQFLAEHEEWFVMYHSDEQYGLTVLSRLPEDRPAEQIFPWSPGFGPGTELREMLSSFGITQKPGCDCLAKQNQMDKWGVDGCRKNYETIVQWMREGSERWGYGEVIRKIAAHPIAAMKLATKVNWIDPYPGLVTEAIRRAAPDSDNKTQNV